MTVVDWVTIIGFAASWVAGAVSVLLLVGRNHGRTNTRLESMERRYEAIEKLCQSQIRRIDELYQTILHESR